MNASCSNAGTLLTVRAGIGAQHSDSISGILLPCPTVEPSVPFFIWKAKFFCHLYRGRTWVSQIAADEDTGARLSAKGRRKVFLNLILPYTSSFQHLGLNPMRCCVVVGIGEKYSREKKKRVESKISRLNKSHYVSSTQHATCRLVTMSWGS